MSDNENRLASQSDSINQQMGTIFNIQRYSIHDGPGIRSTVFFKGCPLQCYWCQNPESQNIKPEILFNKNLCVGCGQCVEVCPVDANTLSAKISLIDRTKCIGCGRCSTVCRAHARSLSGISISVSKVMEEVLKDMTFYTNSGGGVTLSGGEPTMQPEFALAILKSCKKHGIHTALESCGYTSWEKLEPLLKYTDLIFYDLKCMDPIKHQKATGIPNRLIIENAKRIMNRRPTIIRIPLIPGFNDSPENIRATAQFVKSEFRSVNIELLPYNNFGEGKYARLGKEKSRPSEDEQSEEYVNSLKTIIEAEYG